MPRARYLAILMPSAGYLGISMHSAGYLGISMPSARYLTGYRCPLLDISMDIDGDTFEGTLSVPDFGSFPMEGSKEPEY